MNHTHILWDRNSDVLLLGDRFNNIFSLNVMGWCSRAGFAETLAHELGRPIDVIARNDPRHARCAVL